MSSSSNNSNNNRDSSNQKKRKMWRTVNVTAGGGPSQSMTPEAAAKYIQQAANQSSGNSSSSSRNGNSNNGGREVKISFGPSRPPSTSSNGNGNNNNNNNNNRSFNLGNIDLQALKETAAAAAAASKPSKGGGKNINNNNNNNNNSNNGLPCTEAEMKALMSMFVEIMGMSMDSEKMMKATKNMLNNNNSNNKKGPVFMFGNSNGGGGIPMPPGGWSDASAEAMAAATAGFFADGASWEAIRRTYGGMMNGDMMMDDDDDGSEEDGDDDDDDDDDDSLPNLDDMRQLFQAQQKSHFEAMARSRMNMNMNSSSSSSNNFNQEIPPSDWESLEQVAMDDALEAEDRARKAAKKREKKQRRKQKQKEEAAQKAAEAAMKKKEKTILSWRSRVVSACQSGEVSKLDALLHESPLRKAPDEESPLTRSHILPHLEFLLPNSVAKNRSLLNRGEEARKKLAEYILCQDIPIVFQPLRSGRTALHSACFHGDLQFLKLVLERVRNYDDTEDRIPSNYLDQTCAESGWSLLHYASVAGSKEFLEILLQEGCKIGTITDDTHTWRKSDGKGVTARELIQYIHRNEHEKVLETHGVALQDTISALCSNQSERRAFHNNISGVLRRLIDIETNGYSPPKQNNVTSRDENEDWNDANQQQQQQQQQQQESSSSSRKRKKKKKKKQAQKVTEDAKDETAKTTTTQEQKSTESKEAKDPLVMALLGMGFAEQQINAAVEACGGTNRATADDLVTWILGQDADGNDNSNSGPSIVHAAEITAETTIKATSFDQAVKLDAATQEKEEVARRLAMKREEQRRRNRAWNDSQQSRLAEAAKVKAAKAMMPQRQVAPVPPPPEYAAAYPSLLSTVSSGSTTAAAPPPAPPPKSAAVPKPTILPKNIGSKSVAAAPKKAVVPSVKPTSKPAKNEKPEAAPVVIPKILKKPEAEIPPPKAVRKAAPKAAPLAKPHPKVDSPPEIRNIVKEKPVDAKPVPVLAQKIATPVPGLAPLSNGGYNFPSGLPVSSAPLVPPPQSSAPPPGFMAPSPPPNLQPNMPPPGVNFPPLDNSILNPANGIGLHLDQGQMGEIRATAKAFVPTSFGPSIPGGDLGMPPLSSAFANPQPSSGMPAIGGAPESKSMIQSAFAPGILSGGLGGAPGVMGGDNLNGQDRMPSMTPVSTDSTTNTTTSLSGFEESGLAGIPLGFGMGIPQHGTSSLLDSIATGPAPIEASSIWGGPQGGPALDAFSSLGLGDVGGGNNQYDDKNIADANLWGSVASNNPANSNQGSIW
ncbi:unnamed protein product [Cylindrotheca closterium]|uniref:Uncharacterized protein n=1 Tax=Cylindrotheca closterium TaxID=2856 RepID=A0AAD2CUQ1_9STRA|nr:unnamed protein product [Cylindrotheca closterium]